MIKIVKDKTGKFLIGTATELKGDIKLQNPFQLTETKEGVKILPYDVKIIDTVIPVIKFKESDYEYQVEAPQGISDFYKNTLKKCFDDLKGRSEEIEVK